LISIDTSVFGFDLSGSFSTAGGYGQSTIIHEIGHLLGLGHGGYYNGSVSADTQQYSAYDERLWTTMSYIYYGTSSPKYFDSYPKHADWGTTDDLIDRQAPHTVMQLDIEAIQQLYGKSTSGPLMGGQTYGFHTSIHGPLGKFFDFTKNTHP